MIYTVTFNPSLDYIVRLDSFTAGKINRVNYEQVLAGGKGINVSIVLQNLGQKSTALGFLAGFTGEEIKSQLSSFGVKSDFVQLKNGFSRINVKAKAENETEINGQGPDISEAEQEQLFSQLDQLTADDTLVLAGSIQRRCLTTSIKKSWLVSTARASVSLLMPRKICCSMYCSTIHFSSNQTIMSLAICSA